MIVVLTVADLCVSNSRDEDTVEPTPVNTSAAVLVTLALTGGTPKLNNTGYDTIDARPAIELVKPASTPATSKYKLIRNICMDVASNDSVFNVA